jgi:hypothetical protein
MGTNPGPPMGLRRIGLLGAKRSLARVGLGDFSMATRGGYCLLTAPITGPRLYVTT